MADFRCVKCGLVEERRLPLLAAEAMHVCCDGSLGRQVRVEGQKCVQRREFQSEVAQSFDDSLSLCMQRLFRDVGLIAKYGEDAHSNGHTTVGGWLSKGYKSPQRVLVELDGPIEIRVFDEFAKLSTVEVCATVREVVVDRADPVPLGRQVMEVASDDGYC